MFHASKLLHNDHSVFLPFSAKRDIAFMGSCRRAIYGYLGILGVILSSDTLIPTPNPGMTNQYVDLT